MTSIEWTPAKKAVAAGAAIGVGLLVVCSRRRFREHNACPVALDPDLGPAVRRVTLAALEREHDPAILGALATKLEAAGHDTTAKLVAERASQVGAAHVVGQAAPPQATIRSAQLMLQQLGYDVPTSGVMDARTRQAVERFQSLHDLDIDGVLGPATFQMLRALTGGH